MREMTWVSCCRTYNSVYKCRITIPRSRLNHRVEILGEATSKDSLQVVVRWVSCQREAKVGWVVRQQESDGDLGISTQPLPLSRISTTTLQVGRQQPVSLVVMALGHQQRRTKGPVLWRNLPKQMGVGVCARALRCPPTPTRKERRCCCAGPSDINLSPTHPIVTVLLHGLG